MTSASKVGLKEFGDGDAALYNGNHGIVGLEEEVKLTCLESQDDFEAEFHRLLTEAVNKEMGLVTNETETLSKELDGNFLTPQLTSSCPSPLPMKFEEDPLSAVLNHEQQAKELDAPRRRGRPPNTNTKFNTNINLSMNNFHPYQRKFAKTSIQNHPLGHCQMQLRERRSDSDFYSPVWIRGRGTEREGLCPLCEPPVWLKIKQSAYWYHMNFFHGISATTGRPYKRPLSYRYPAKQVEGHCGKCLKWILLTTEYTGDRTVEAVEQSVCFSAWFKHAQKCHYRTKEFQIPDTFK